MAIFKKVKEWMKKAIVKPEKIKKVSASGKASGDTEKELLGVREMAVEKTKFSTPEQVHRPASRRMLEELPGGYNQDKIVLQVRDTRWIHAYWEVTFQTMDNLKARLGSAFYAAKRVLRIYDVTDIIFNGNNAHHFFDIEVGHESTSWYIDTNNPGKSWCVDVGLRLASGEFILIARSNVVHTPIDGPSWITDEEWMIPDDMFARLYGMGFGFGRSSPVGKAWQERIKQALFSGVLASPGITSVASPVKKQAQRQFWMAVNTELIVYGATEPDAALTVQGKPIKLRQDGTFTLRFALPDGKQVIPVQATSADKVETRTITPIVTKETK